MFAAIPHSVGSPEVILATETAQLAENLPDGVTVRLAVGDAIDKEHLADLLFSICLARTIGL
jgi:hypothetical protein